MKHKDYDLTITELHHSYFSLEFLRFWEVLLGGGFQSYLNRLKHIKVTNIVSIGVILKSLSYTFWIYFHIFDYFWSLLKSFSGKFQISIIHKICNCFGMKEQKKQHHIFLWKFLKVLVKLFFKVLLSGCSRSTLANKNMLTTIKNSNCFS